jgi:hypothetical protein
VTRAGDTKCRNRFVTLGDEEMDVAGRPVAGSDQECRKVAVTETPSVAHRSRYDAFAEWYVSWVREAPGLTCDPAADALAPRLSGERWLDVACGAGPASRELARRGASVVGVDLSEELIAKARAAEGWWISGDHNPDGVRIRVGSNHRTLSMYLNALIDARLRLERVFEPPAAVPTALLLVCRKA